MDIFSELKKNGVKLNLIFCAITGKKIDEVSTDTTGLVVEADELRLQLALEEEMLVDVVKENIDTSDKIILEAALTKIMCLAQYQDEEYFSDSAENLLELLHIEDNEIALLKEMETEARAKLKNYFKDETLIQQSCIAKLNEVLSYAA